jgi:hypothetical protein
LPAFGELFSYTLGDHDARAPRAILSFQTKKAGPSCQ